MIREELERERKRLLKLLEKYKLETGTTYRELSKQIGRAPITINDWLRGIVTPEVESLYRIREFLKKVGYYKK